MDSASAVEIGRPAIQRQTLWRYFRGDLKTTEYTWALAFVVPYVAVFLTFVAYPVAVSYTHLTLPTKRIV